MVAVPPRAGLGACSSPLCPHALGSLLENLNTKSCPHLSGKISERSGKFHNKEKKCPRVTTGGREVEGGRNAATWWPATTWTGVCGSAELGAAYRASGGPRPGLPGWCGR